jgi:hypothetical protein
MLPSNAKAELCIDSGVEDSHLLACATARTTDTIASPGHASRRGAIRWHRSSTDGRMKMVILTGLCKADMGRGREGRQDASSKHSVL